MWTLWVTVPGPVVRFYRDEAPCLPPPTDPGVPLKKPLAAAAAALMITATLAPAPASAAPVTCSADSTVSSWRAKCDRRTDSNDPGGVSGTARVEYSGNTRYHASIRFEAHGEHVYMTNNTTTTAYLRLYTQDQHGRWRAYIDYVLGAGESGYRNESFKEDMPLRIQACVYERGCASLYNLKS